MDEILGGPMLNRLTVSALLKTVILATAFCVVVGFSLNAWDSWGRLQVTSRIAVVADTSANLFKAMHNLRTDRSTTNRLLNSDQPMDADIEKYLRGLRDAEMPAMSSALGLLPTIEFAAAEDAGAGARSPVQDIDRASRRNSGTKSASRRPRAARRWPRNIWTPRACCLRRWTNCPLRSPPRSTIRTPRSTSCWRSSRPPGCCATPAARLRC